MDYGDLESLTRRTVADKVLRVKAFNIAKNTKYDGYLRGVSSMIYKFFDKTSATHAEKSAKRGAIKIEIILNQQSAAHLANGLRKPIFKNYVKKRKVYSSFKNNRWSVDLADINMSGLFP